MSNYYSSNRWAGLKKQVMTRVLAREDAGVYGICERCGYVPRKVHSVKVCHVTDKCCGDETAQDLALLCVNCQRDLKSYRQLQRARKKDKLQQAVEDKVGSGA